MGKNRRLMLVMAAIFGGLFTNIAFAASALALTSHVNITRSGSGTVRLKSSDGNIVEPSPAGTIATGSDVINVDTNCSAGYDVYVSSTSTGDTDLVLAGAATPVASNNKIEASSNTMDSPSTLAKDTWGVGKTNSAFSGLQAYNANITSLTPFYHDTTTDGKDFTFYYGANVSTDKTPGEYDIDVLYTVLAKPSCVEYTLSFDTSSATDVLSPGTYITRTIGVDELVNLATLSSSSNIVKNDHHIAGWRNKDNTSQTYGITGDVDVNPDDLSTITLEPIWAADAYFQDADACSSIPVGTTGTLRDSRDNQDYTVYHFADSNAPTGMGSFCLMTQDLSLGYTTSGSITKGTDLTLTTAESAAAATITARTGTSDWSTNNSYDNQQYINGTGGTYDSHSYYSYGAAQAVCPKGWRPPTNTEHSNIVTFMGGNNDIGSSTIRSAPYNFIYGGYFGSSGWSSVGSSGNYWSSTQGSSTIGYRLYFASNSLSTGNDARNGGRPVRCVFDPNLYMQDISAADLAEGQTTMVKDSRDNQDYTVYRWPSTGTAGTDYPTGMAGYAIMTQDLSLGYVTGGSITKGQSLALTTADSTIATTITSKVGQSWSTTYGDSNFQYTNGPKSGQEAYTSHSYYSYDAAQVVCPKGWRLPTKTEYDNIKTFMGGDNATGSSTIRSAPYNFIYGDFFTSDGWGSTVGITGSYWTSTQYSSTQGHYLYFDSNYLRSTNYTSKYFGMSARCIVAPPAYMQDISATDLVENQTTIVRDSRDNQGYTVYRWPSTGTAGTDYPTGMAGYAIMTQDLSLGYVTGGSVTKNADLALTTADSAAAATIVARTGTSDWSTSSADSNLQYINGPQSGQEIYTSHSYYSYYAAQAVCPKGWRLPTQTEHSNIVTFMGGRNATGSTKIRSIPYNFVYGGTFVSSGWNAVGTRGDYWSSTQYSSSNGYYLYFYSNDLRGSYIDNNGGRSVRCIASPSSSTGGCFTAGTRVQTTTDGETKAIEDIKIGDKVVSYDPNNQEYYLAEVQDTIVHDGTERFTKLAKLTLDNGTTLEMTLNHPILTTSGYKAIQNIDYLTLTKDDIIITTTGKHSISAIDIYDTEPTVVYNLTVSGRNGDTPNGPTHSYIANGVVVHNVATGG